MNQLSNGGLTRLANTIADLPRRSFLELCDPDPWIRFFAARTILDMARSPNEEITMSVAAHMDAHALQKVMEDPNWKVRRAGKAAVRGLAASIGPRAGIPADPQQDPLVVCQTVQAYREQLDIILEAVRSDRVRGRDPSKINPVKLRH